MGGKNGKAAPAELGPHLFKLGRVVGRGSFGKVYVVILKHNKKMYAMKQLSKKEVLERNMVESVTNEKLILAHLDFPLITNLHFCYQTETHLHMIMDLMMGGDVGFHLGTDHKFEPERSQFYSACIVLSLEYLHTQKSIIHRDLKPGNLLLGSDGYCHLTDFNVSTVYDPNKPPTSCSGTKRYMAPEVLQRKPYSFPVDIWSLGICVHEFLSGKTPWSGQDFHDDGERVQAMLSGPNISGRLPKDAVDFVTMCLQVDPDQRPNFDQIKSHPYFASINWEELVNKKIKAPFIPEKNRAYIDVNHDLEDQLVPEKKRKVTAEENQKFSDWDWVRDPSLFLPGSSPRRETEKREPETPPSGRREKEKEKEKEKEDDDDEKEKEKEREKDEKEKKEGTGADSGDQNNT